ncbi:GNAT family N-acetyltransferase [Streptomyces sp. NPDC004779]
MRENTRNAGDEDDGEVTREIAWPAGSVGLAALDTEDAELLHGWRSDPVTAHQLGLWPHPLTALRERIERDIENDDRDDFLVVVPEGPGGLPIGYAALTGQNIVDGAAQVEVVIAAEHRGRGHGAAALDALVDLAFGELPMYRLTAETHTDNSPALAVLAASGFVEEGVRRAACLHRGRRHDLAVFSLLRPEWEGLDRPRAWDA